MENYKLIIVLEGVEYEVILKEGETCSKEESQDFIKAMVKSDCVNYINTDKGIIGYDSKAVKSVFYKAVKIS